MRWRKRWLFPLILIVLLAVLGWAGRYHARGALLLMDVELSGKHASWMDPLYPAVQRSQNDLADIKSVRYSPQGGSGGGILIIVHGVHHLGSNEPRLQNLARAFASRGITVYTPELPGIADYSITPDSIRTIGEAAKRVKGQYPTSRIGVMGLSFSGGLALMAAADERYMDSIEYVVAVGAHGDMERVARFFTTGKIEAPDGRALQTEPHEYGVLVLMYAAPEQFFPPAEAQAARGCLRLQLYERGTEAIGCASRLSPASQEKMKLLREHRSQEFRPQLQKYLAENKAAMAKVSPQGRLGRIRVPVLLLHGAGDNVVPPAETLWLAQEIPAAHVHGTLVSPAISHVEMQAAPDWRDKWALVSFMAHTLREADGH